MFPYPSGAGLHVGHLASYTPTDVVARFKRMHGFEVLHPMGYDAFGLPAEQYAIQTGIHPAETTRKAIENFRRQLKSFGYSFDWSREISTCEPKFYKWTQYIFLKLFDRGLAYQKEVPVNWCPALKTVLANEEVIDGKSERGGHPVVRMPMKQWMLKITDYAERLSRRVWIKHRLAGTGQRGPAKLDRQERGREGYVPIARPQRNFGGLHHPSRHAFRRHLYGDRPRASVGGKPDDAGAKRGSDRVPGKPPPARARSTGKPRMRKDRRIHWRLRDQSMSSQIKQIPVWIADYVLMDYGTGAIMAVPGHDTRDFDFAKTISAARRSRFGSARGNCLLRATASSVNSEFLNGLESPPPSKE